MEDAAEVCREASSAEMVRSMPPSPKETETGEAKPSERERQAQGGQGQGACEQQAGVPASFPVGQADDSKPGGGGGTQESAGVRPAYSQASVQYPPLPPQVGEEEDEEGEGKRKLMKGKRKKEGI